MGKFFEGESGTVESLTNLDNSVNRLEVLIGIQRAYTGTDVQNESGIKEILDLGTIDTANPNVAQSNLATTNINTLLGTKINLITGIINTQPPVASVPSWKTVFDNTYYICDEGRGSRGCQWEESSWIAGMYSYRVSLDSTGIWVNNFRPTKIRIFHNDPTPGTLIIRDFNSMSDPNIEPIIQVSNYVSGTEIDLNFTGVGDISNIYLDSMSYPSQGITNIEFYTNVDF